MEKFIKKLIPYSWLIVLVGIGLSVLSFKPAIKLLSHVNTEPAKLLPDSNPSVVLSDEIDKKFKKKGGGDLVILVSSPNPIANQKAIDALVAYLSKLPEVERIKYQKEGYEFLNDHKLLYMDLEDIQEVKERIHRKIQQEKLGGLYVDFESNKNQNDPFQFGDLNKKYRNEYIRVVKSPYYTNEDGTAYALWLYPRFESSASFSEYRRFYERIHNSLENFDLSQFGTPLKISYAGAIKTRLNEYSALLSDLLRGGIISFYGILLILVLYFSRFFSLILLFIPLAFGILGGFAISSTFLSHLNIVTSFLFSILSGLGIEIGIHLFSRYNDDREAGVSRDQALINMLTKTGRSAISGVLLNCVIFFVLVINQFRGFSEFGWIAGISYLLSLASFLIFFPALLVVGESIGFLRFKPHKKRILSWLKNHIKNFPAPGIIGSICLALFAFFLFLSPFVKFEWQYSVLKIRVPETEKARVLLRDITGKANTAAAVIIPNEETAMAIRQEYEDRKEADKQSPTLDFFRSHYDLFPTEQDQKIRLLREIDFLLKDDALNVVKGKDRELINDFRAAIARTKKVYSKEEIPKNLKSSFFGKGEYSKEQVGFVNPIPDLELDDGRNAIAFYRDAYEVKVGNKSYYAISDSMVFADVLTTMFRDSKKVMILSILFLIFVIYLDFRNLRNSILAFGSILWGVIGMMALMVLLDLKYNFYNMVMIPLVFGMTVDSSVHLIHRFEELGRSSVTGALFTSGAAAFISSLTNMLGYSGLLIAHHPGLNSIGNLAVIGMSTCMIGSLLFLPATLQWMTNRRKFIAMPS